MQEPDERTAKGRRHPLRAKPAVGIQTDRAVDVETAALARHQEAVLQEVLQWLSRQPSEPGAAANDS